MVLQDYPASAYSDC